MVGGPAWPIAARSRRLSWRAQRRWCDLYLEKQAVDTIAPAGRALFQMLGVFAELERAIFQERIHAGTARARIVGMKSGKPIARARIDATKEAAIRAALASGKGILKTAHECGTGSSAVQRIKAEMVRGNNPNV